MSQDNMQGASTTDLAPEASASAEAVPPLNGATTMAFTANSTAAEQRSLMLDNLRAMAATLGIETVLPLVRIFTSRKAVDLTDDKVEVVLETIRLVCEELRATGRYNSDAGDLTDVFMEAAAKADIAIKLRQPRKTSMLAGVEVKISTESDAKTLSTFLGDAEFFIGKHGNAYMTEVSWAVSNSPDFSGVPIEDFPKVSKVINAVDEWLDDKRHRSETTPDLIDIRNYAAQCFQALCTDDIMGDIGIHERRDIMLEAAGDLRDLLDNDEAMGAVLDGIGYNHGTEVPDDQIDRVTGIFINIIRTVQNAGYMLSLYELKTLVTQEVERAARDSKSEAPASDDTATTLEGKIADTSTAEAIDEMSSEHAQHAIDREMEQAAHEKQMLRIQTMINIGVGVVMSSVGVTSIKITSEALQKFSRDYEVVTEPTEDGGYTIELLDRSSMAYSQYVAAQMEGISDSVGVPAANLNLVNPGEI